MCLKKKCEPGKKYLSLAVAEIMKTRRSLALNALVAIQILFTIKMPDNINSILAEKTPPCPTCKNNKNVIMRAQCKCMQGHVQWLCNGCGKTFDTKKIPIEKP